MSGPGCRPFLGRDGELAELRAALDDALAGRGRLCLVVGEPGIGKTRLADEVGVAALERGARVLWGRSWEEDGAPAFWPWRQALRAFVETANSEALRRDLDPVAGDLAQLLPEAAERAPTGPPEPRLTDDEVRFRLFEGVASLLRRASRRHPLVLVLDDLHWADVSSLTLLRFVARDLHDTRVLLVGTCRDVEVAADPARGRIVADIAREGRVLALQGITREAIAGIVEATTGTAPSPAVVAAIHARTDGNPFFVSEVVQLLVAEGPLDDAERAAGIPPGVRQTIRRRLERLSTDCRRTLALAAVIGREVDLAVLGSLSGAAPDRLLALIGEATDARLLLDDPRAGRARFAHALVRDALYEEVAVAERRDLHRRIGEAIAADGPRGRATELACHFRLAGDTARALEYAERAGDECRALLAFEEAAEQYQVALDLLPADSEQDERACNLRLALGDVSMRAGDRRRAREVYVDAAAAARALDRRDLFARATLGYCGRFDITAEPGERMLDLLEEALAGIGTEDSPHHARLLARLAVTIYFLGELARAQTLSRRAVAMAERLDDARVHANALGALHLALWGPDHLDERLAVAERMIATARDGGDREAAISAHLWRLMDALEQGNLASADTDAVAHERLAEELRQPFYLWGVPSLRLMRAVMEGRLADAERALEEAVALAARAQSDNAPMRAALQLFLLRRAQGRLAEVEPALALIAERQPRIAGFRAALAAAHVHLGRLAEARLHFERLAAERFASVTRDGWWMSTMAALAEVCAALGDAARATTLYDLLSPYADRVVVVSFAHGCEGALARHLGLLAATTGRFDDAERHFVQALATNRRLGATLLVAHTVRDHARVLLARGDAMRAARLLAEADAIYTALGVAHLREPAGGPVTSDAAGDAYLFRREGKHWTVGASARRARLRDTKGLRYIAHLLANPGREFHVGELLRLTDAEAASGRRAGVGPLLDRRARSDYERRVAALRDQLEEAEGFNDGARAERLREEIDAIAGELARAYGLGGHARHAADPLERLRKAVTNRIRDGLARVREVDEEIGRHLAPAIRTGTFCAYAPRRAVRWEL